MSPFAFISAVREFFDGMVIVGGGIADGTGVAGAVTAGADLVYMGTRFLATEESIVSEEYRRMLVESGADEIVYTPSISTIPANFLRSSIVNAGLNPDALPDPERVDLSHVTNQHAEEQQSTSAPKAWRDVWSAGHSVAGISEVLPVADLVDRLEAEYLTAKGELLALIDG